MKTSRKDTSSKNPIITKWSSRVSTKKASGQFAIIMRTDEGGNWLAAAAAAALSYYPPFMTDARLLRRRIAADKRAT